MVDQYHTITSGCLVTVGLLWYYHVRYHKLRYHTISMVPKSVCDVPIIRRYVPRPWKLRRFVCWSLSIQEYRPAHKHCRLFLLVDPPI